MHNVIEFTRLYHIAPQVIANHMSDPRVAEHMPLLTFQWSEETAEDFVRAKEACWSRDGLGHWAILLQGEYVGWGGFQKEGSEWDFGLVLQPQHFGLGLRIWQKALEFARADERITSITFLLPPSRKSLSASKRLRAEFVSKVEYQGKEYLKYRLHIA